MPEGHSLERAARRLRPIVGARVDGGPLAGAVVSGVEARGKHLLVHTADGRCLHAHLGLHGGVRLRPPGEGRGRYVLRTAAGDLVIAGRVGVAARPPQLALGPDLLHGRFDAAEYLRRARAVDRPIGELLLDQRVLAGIGNIVKSETLWERRQSPFQRRLRRLGPAPARARRDRPPPAPPGRHGPAPGQRLPSHRSPVPAVPDADPRHCPGRPRPSHLPLPGVPGGVIRRRDPEGVHDRARGAMLGLAVGDALGAPVEWLHPDQIRSRYGGPLRDMVASAPWELGEWTDDTAMAMALAESLADQGAYDENDVFGRYAMWARSRPKDIGATVAAALRRARSADEARAAAQAFHEAEGRSAGNGSLMRTVPIAIRYRGDPGADRAHLAHRLGAHPPRPARRRRLRLVQSHGGRADPEPAAAAVDL